MKKISIFIISIFLLGACTQQETETYERFYFRTDGSDLAVEVNGNINSNTFIVLIHGGPGGGSYQYNSGKYSEMLEQEYAMVYLDQRGQGASQGSYSAENLTLQQFSDDIYNLVLFLKQKYGQEISVFLMGHSWGGTTGTHALLHTEVQSEISGWIEAAGAHDIPLLNKEALKMFVEIGAVEIASGRNVSDWMEILGFVATVNPLNITEEDGGQINSYGFTAEGLIDKIKFSEEPPRFSHGVWTMPVISTATVLSNGATANVITPETEVLALTDRLHEITVPTLLLWGKYDFVVPPALGESALENIGTDDKKLVIFEASGHSLMDTEPGLYVDEVSAFVEAHK